MTIRRLLSCVLLVTVGGATLHAQLLNGRFVTSFYTWEQSDTVGASTTYLRAFQAAQVSYSNGDLSLHTSILGTLNMADSFGDAGFLRVYNLYLRWSNIAKMVDLSLGRQAVYAGAGIGTIDGALVKVRPVKEKLTIVGYWGSVVRPEFTGVRKNWHDNAMFGGQILAFPVQDLRIGLSYMNKREERTPYWTLRARDTTFAPAPYYIEQESRSQEILSGDASYGYRTLVTIYGRYDHDLLLAKASRAQAGLRLNITPSFALLGDFIYREPRISYNSIFSAFVANASREVGGGIEYGFTPLLKAFARYASVTYNSESSQRWSIGLNSGFGSLSYSGSNGYAGELQSFSLSGAYPLMNNRLVPQAGISFASYQLSAEDQRQDALSLVLGAMVRPVQSLSVDLQGQMLTNRLYKNDLRLQAKLTYWFSEPL